MSLVVALGGVSLPRPLVERVDGSIEELPGRCEVRLVPGDRLGVETPGGGGFGEPDEGSGSQ